MSVTLPEQIERVLVSEAEIDGLVTGLARRLEADFAGCEPVLIGVLTGAVMLVADLARRISLPLSIDFVAVSSYGDGTTSTGRLVWEKRPRLALTGRDVILVEDIVDTGCTLAKLQEALRAMDPARLVTVSLLDKPARRQAQVAIDYLGRAIPDEFVVGYGLDWAQRFRHLPYIGVLRREVYHAPETDPAAGEAAQP